MYAHNNGQAEIYRVSPGVSSKGAPVYSLGERLGVFWFSYVGIRADEHYAAQAASVAVLKRIEILRREVVESGQVVIIAGERFKAGRVFHGHNKKGVPVTEITLEKEARRFDDK